jgi:hypothetical protein
MLGCHPRALCWWNALFHLLKQQARNSARASTRRTSPHPTPRSRQDRPLCRIGLSMPPSAQGSSRRLLAPVVFSLTPSTVSRVRPLAPLRCSRCVVAVRCAISRRWAVFPQRSAAQSRAEAATTNSPPRHAHTTHTQAQQSVGRTGREVWRVCVENA